MINTNTIAIGGIIIVILIILRLLVHPKKKNNPKLVFTFFNNKNYHPMAILNSLTLTDRNPVTLHLSVVDENNKNAVIPGVLSNILVSPGDATKDTAILNPTVAQGVDVEAVSADGGTTVNATGDFKSDAAKPDGTPEVSGNFSAVLTVVNNIVVKAAMVFNQ
jgi:hypothetical protein